MKNIFAGIFLTSFSLAAHADFFEGLAAYKHQDFKVAQREFAQLLPLGNGAAAFNLAIMSYQGQGETADAIKATALFAIADECGEARAKPLLDKILPALTPEQIAAVNAKVEQYRQQMQISKNQRGWMLYTKDPVHDFKIKVQKKVSPVFSAKAALNGRLGEVSMLSILDKDGTVMFVDGYESLDRNMFIKGTKSAFQKWQFEPMPQKVIYKMSYHFFYEADEDQLRNSRLESWKALQQDGLYELAAQGSAQHQFAFGKILQRLEDSTNVVFYPDKSLALDKPYPDRMVYQTAKTSQQIDLILERGSAVIQVDENHKIVHERQRSYDQDPTLVGKQMASNVAPGWYKLVFSHNYENDIRMNYLVDIKMVPPEHFSYHWISQAAINGDLTAQRELAMGRSDWRNYLALKEDPKGLLWAAMYAMQDGDDAKAKELLLKAKAKGETQAEELLAKLPQ